MSLCPHRLLCGLVGEVEAEFGVQVGLVLWVCVSDRFGVIAEPVDESADLVVGHGVLPRGLA